MQNQNRFLKLLLFLTGEGDFILLYGFSSDTGRQPYEWRKRAVPKTRRCVLSAILPREEAFRVEQSLTEQEEILLGDVKIFGSRLLKRPSVSANDRPDRASGPVSGYRRLTELWNVQKETTLRTVKEAFGTDGKTLYEEVKALLSWARQECGIDFLNQGYRFGNFESYQTPILADAFEIIRDKEGGLRSTAILKREPCEKNLIVNCVAEHRERSLINQTKRFPAADACLTFTASEPMSRVTVQIWEEESGELLFFQDVTLVMQISFGLDVSSAQLSISDPWSEKLLSSAGDRKDDIKSKIEAVSHTSRERTVTVKSDTHSVIDEAMEEGNRLFAGFQRKKSGGAFIPNIQKDGEIGSFLKVREYIEPASVKRVVIADPYFSVPSAAKLLTRISRTDVRIDVISALGKTDPDTGAESDICEVYRKFLWDHAPLLHHNLSVCNLRRGDRPVFHDRYLIRYFTDGRIDGFLLSNSLNSMGQFYPFVIAPMDQEVCLEVCEYLNWMCDTDAQEKRRKEERIVCDVLFDSKEQEKLSAAVSPEPAIYKPWSAADRENVLRDEKGAAAAFLEEFSALAKKAEQRQNSMRKDMYDPAYTLWALLHDKAKPSRQGFELLFRESGHICYEKEGWLKEGYFLMLELDPDVFCALLEEIKSPLMFDALAFWMLFRPWSDRLYDAVLHTGVYCMHLLGAEGLFYQLETDSLSDGQVKETLEKLAPEARALQVTYLLSRIAFHMRARRMEESRQKQWRALREWLLGCAAADLLCCPEEVQKTALHWLYDCEERSYCKLHLDLAALLTDCELRTRLLETAVAIVEHPLADRTYESDDTELIFLYLQGMERLHGEQTENKILGKLVRWEVFETATEPELRNYQYDRWHQALVRAKRQMAILKAFRKNHPEAEKTAQWIREWENRLTEALDF